MRALVSELKARARILHRQARDGDPEAIRRVRTLPELRKLDPEQLSAELQRKHGLAVVARELGFDGWQHAIAMLTGQGGDDHGTVLYPRECWGHWNIWSASYEEARGIREEHGGYLLPYKHQFFIVEGNFIDTIGLDPEDEDWARIGRDWVRPADPEARTRLYVKLIQARLRAREAAPGRAA